MRLNARNVTVLHAFAVMSVCTPTATDMPFAVRLARAAPHVFHTVTDRGERLQRAQPRVRRQQESHPDLDNIRDLEQQVQQQDAEQQPTSSAASSSWSPTVLRPAELLDSAASPTPSAPTASSSTSWDLISAPATGTVSAGRVQSGEPSRPAASAPDTINEDHAGHEATHLINHATHKTKQSDTFDTFHFIKGHKMHGILIDFGAAKGLIGSDTLNDIIENILKPCAGVWRCASESPPS